jgi:ECF sigma factor
MMGHMNDITRVLHSMAQGDPHTAEELLLLVYDEMRKLAAAKSHFLEEMT